MPDADMTDPAPQGVPRGTLMQGKRGVIMGVANDRSIAWGVAQALAAQGAEIAFTYQGDALEKRVRPLAESVGSTLVLPCDVTDDASVRFMSRGQNPASATVRPFSNIARATGALRTARCSSCTRVRNTSNGCVTRVAIKPADVLHAKVRAALGQPSPSLPHERLNES